MAISATQIQIENASFDGYVHNLKQVTRKSELNDRTVLDAGILVVEPNPLLETPPAIKVRGDRDNRGEWSAKGA
jgi:hypothetical protein